MADHHFYLGPWVWERTPDGGGWWRPPAGCVGAVDLRAPRGTQGQRDGGTGGGVFAMAARMADETEFVYLGEDKHIVADWLWQQLTTQSDPQGVTAPLPLMPGSDGMLELHLGQLGKVRSEPWRGTATPHWPRVREMVRSSYRRIRLNTAGNPPHNMYRKYLSMMASKLDVDWQELIPPDLPVESPVAPTTSVGDDFNRPDEDLDASPNWSTKPDASTCIMEVVSQQVQTRSFDPDPGKAVYRTGIHQTQLSSDDHRARALLIDSHTHMGLACRCDPASSDCYSGGISDTPAYRILKLLGGVFTDLVHDKDFGAPNGAYDGKTYRFTADGSTLTLDREGAQVASATDTALTGAPHVGMLFYEGGQKLDDWSAEDLQSQNNGDAGGVALTQSAAAGFPDRPPGGGMGLALGMTPGSSGSGGRYLQRDLAQPRERMHTRVMLNPHTASGGKVAIVRGMAENGAETMRLIFDALERSIHAELPAGQRLSASLPEGIGWHCVELGLDAQAGEARLWVDGRPRQVMSGLAGLGATRRLWIGGMFKDPHTEGELYLDEWVIAGAYIGPVVVSAAGEYADAPARWLVLYNEADADSRLWADSYRRKRGVPYANLLGLELPPHEQISEAQFESMREAIQAYLSRHALEEQVMGILCGHGVPGTYVRSLDGGVQAVAAQLQRMDGSTQSVSNPLAPASPAASLARPGAGALEGNRLTARIDAPTLALSQALTDRALALESERLSASDAVVWLDAHGPADPQYDAREQRMLGWAGSLDGRRLRLPIRLTREQVATDPHFSSIEHDGFFWGWARLQPPTGFFGSPEGRRAFGIQLAFEQATCPTLREAGHPSWPTRALENGYAATAGSSRPHGTAAVPMIRPFFEALRRGWTLSEAWMLACPQLRAGLMLVGDPLMTLSFPQMGWNVYGPFHSWEHARFTKPLAMLRAGRRELSLAQEDLPAPDAQGIYVVRPVDAQGREETGFDHVRVVRRGDAPVAATWPPAWPAARGWFPARRGDRLHLAGVWGARFGRLGISEVRLVEQIDGQGQRVAHSVAVDPRSSRVRRALRPGGQRVRYQWRAVTEQGAEASSPWSRWIEPADPPSIVQLRTVQT